MLATQVPFFILFYICMTLHSVKGLIVEKSDYLTIYTIHHVHPQYRKFWILKTYACDFRIQEVLLNLYKKVNKGLRIMTLMSVKLKTSQRQKVLRFDQASLWTLKLKIWDLQEIRNLDTDLPWRIFVSQGKKNYWCFFIASIWENSFNRPIIMAVITSTLLTIVRTDNFS